MKTLKAQVIISLITCFFLVLAVTICKGNYNRKPNRNFRDTTTYR